MEIFTPTTSTRSITHMEKRVLQLIVDGCENEEIASKLDFSLDDVEEHRRSIFDKMKVDNVFKLVRMALEHKLVD